MTVSAEKRIEFFTNIFLSVISKAIKENIDGLEAGKIALKIVGCPEDVALEIERLTIIQLNKN